LGFALTQRPAGRVCFDRATTIIPRGVGVQMVTGEYVLRDFW